MSAQQATLNRIWAQTVLEELARFGVQDVCIAPGSRSTPLALEAKAQAKFTLHTHFDERGLGFLALGIAKQSQRPVAVIVTSGTAVANLLPATAESGLTGEKLVLLTSDRPIELVGCGANQAINQQGIFSTHVTQSVNLPSPSTSLPLNWLLTTVDEALYQQQRVGGAIQINFPFPEPLYSDHDLSPFSAYLNAIARWQQSEAPYTRQIVGQTPTPSLDSHLFTQRGVIIIGSVSLAEAQKGLALAKQLGWPVLCDPQSGVSSEWAHFDLWLQHQTGHELLNRAQCVIQLGSRLVSKRLGQWLASLTNRDVEYVYVSPHLERNNPAHLIQTHVQAEIGTWLDDTLTSLAASSEAPNRCLAFGWADSLKPLVASINAMIKDFTAEASLTEIAVAVSAKHLPQNTNVFVGNSLFVRLLDMFATWPELEVFTNRGASGIDGLVATASGVQRSQSQPQVVFIGDTSLLYDLNSLALMRTPQAPVAIVVLNNDGGAIFDLLPVPSEQREALYQMPHGLHFEHAAQQFGLAYCKPDSLSDYQQLLSEHLSAGQGTLIIEVVTPPEQAAQHIKQLMGKVNAL